MGCKTFHSSGKFEKGPAAKTRYIVAPSSDNDRNYFSTQWAARRDECKKHIQLYSVKFGVDIFLRLSIRIYCYRSPYKHSLVFIFF